MKNCMMIGHGDGHHDGDEPFGEKVVHKQNNTQEQHNQHPIYLMVHQTAVFVTVFVHQVTPFLF